MQLTGRPLSLGVIALSLAATFAQAAVHVRDSQGTPIPAARVTVDTGEFATTDAEGRVLG